MDSFEGDINIQSILNDTDLNAELAQLGWSEPVALPKSAPATARNGNQTNNSDKNEHAAGYAAHSFESIDISGIGVVDESNVQLTDEDLKDESLLQEFESLSNNSGHKPSEDLLGGATADSSYAALIPSRPPPPAQIPVSAPVPPSPSPPVASSGDAPTVAEAKKKAIQFKREGNTAEALKWIRYAKQLERGGSDAAIAGATAAAKQFGSGMSVSLPPQQPHQPPPPRPASMTRQTSEDSTISSLTAGTAADLSSTMSYLSAPQAKVAARGAAVGRQPVLEEGSASQASSSSAGAYSSAAQSGGVAVAASATAAQVDAFSPLEYALNEAIKQALREAKKYQNSDKRQAITRMKEYKAFQQDLVVLRSRRVLAGARPALFHWDVVRKEQKIENTDLGEDQIKLVIEGAYGISAIVESHQSRSIGLSYTLGLSKDETAPTVVAPATYEDGNVEFNHQVVASQLKRSRNAQHLYARKKAVFDIILHRGFFRSSEVLGQAVLPLNTLLHKSSCGGELQLKAVGKEGGGSSSVKKGTVLGGCLRVYAFIRTPLLTPEVEVVEERNLVLGPWPAIEEEASATCSPTSTPGHIPSTAAATPKAAATPTNSDGAAAASGSIAAAGAASGSSAASSSNSGNSRSSSKLCDDLAAQLSEREKTDPLAVDLIESNDVLEAEIIEVSQQLQQQQLDDDEKFALTMRLQLLQGKMQLLVYKVQSGALDMGDYLELLRKRIQQDQKIALYCNSLGDSEGRTSAVKVMRRVRIMKTEVKNAEEQMAAAEEGEEEETVDGGDGGDGGQS